MGQCKEDIYAPELLPGWPVCSPLFLAEGEVESNRAGLWGLSDPPGVRPSELALVPQQGGSVGKTPLMAPYESHSLVFPIT